MHHHAREETEPGPSQLHYETRAGANPWATARGVGALQELGEPGAAAQRAPGPRLPRQGSLPTVPTEKRARLLSDN